MTAVNRSTLSFQKAHTIVRRLLFAAIIAIQFEVVAQAQQWITSGNNIYNANSGNVGVKTTSPGAILDIGTANSGLTAGFAGLRIFGDSNNERFGIESSSSPVFQAGFTRGTLASRSAVQNGDFLAFFQAGGYDGVTQHFNRARMVIYADGNYTTTSTPTGILFQTVAPGSTTITERMRIDGSGKIGIGAATPQALLTVGSRDAGIGEATNKGVIQIQSYGGASATGGGGLEFKSSAWGDGFGWHLGAPDLSNGNAPFIVSYRASAATWTEALRITNSGNVGIGTSNPSAKLDVAGDVVVSGNISAKYQDLAEWVPSTQAIVAGSVVILDQNTDNGVLPSSEPYDTRVAGVVSDSPGIVLGEGGPGKLKVATTGRVKVRVDATQAPIQRGDLLVTSDKPGLAMKSEPLEIAGRKFHQPGTLIGKALEPLSGGEGEILVLLSLQ